MAMEIVCPWPDRRLSPNARVHWAQKSKAAKAYRELGFYATKVAKAAVEWDGPIHAFITFYPPDRRNRDDDNLIASFKNCRDGIAEALGVDDKRFRCHPLVHADTVAGGRVVVRLCQDIREIRGIDDEF